MNVLWMFSYMLALFSRRPSNALELSPGETANVIYYVHNSGLSLFESSRVLKNYALSCTRSASSSNTPPNPADGTETRLID